MSFNRATYCQTCSNVRVAPLIKYVHKKYIFMYILYKVFIKRSFLSFRMEVGIFGEDCPKFCISILCNCRSLVCKLDNIKHFFFTAENFFFSASNSDWRLIYFIMIHHINVYHIWILGPTVKLQTTYNYTFGKVLSLSLSIISFLFSTLLYDNWTSAL